MVLMVKVKSSKATFYLVFVRVKRFVVYPSSVSWSFKKLMLLAKQRKDKEKISPIKQRLSGSVWEDLLSCKRLQRTSFQQGVKGGEYRERLNEWMDGEGGVEGIEEQEEEEEKNKNDCGEGKVEDEDEVFSRCRRCLCGG